MSKLYKKNIKVLFQLDGNPEFEGVGRPVRNRPHGIEIEVSVPIKNVLQGEKIVVPRSEIIKVI